MLVLSPTLASARGGEESSGFLSLALGFSNGGPLAIGSRVRWDADNQALWGLNTPSRWS